MPTNQERLSSAGSMGRPAGDDYLPRSSRVFSNKRLLTCVPTLKGQLYMWDRDNVKMSGPQGGRLNRALHEALGKCECSVAWDP